MCSAKGNTLAGSVRDIPWSSEQGRGKDGGIVVHWGQHTSRQPSVSIIFQSLQTSTQTAPQRPVQGRSLQPGRAPPPTAPPEVHRSYSAAHLMRLMEVWMTAPSRSDTCKHPGTYAATSGDTLLEEIPPQLAEYCCSTAATHCSLVYRPTRR
jgi:hypothetical protein